MGQGFWQYEDLPEAARFPERIIPDGIPSTVVYEKAVLVADAMGSAGMPRYPYLYELLGD